jgi:hypothetical protein
MGRIFGRKDDGRELFPSLHPPTGWEEGNEVRALGSNAKKIVRRVDRAVPRSS